MSSTEAIRKLVDAVDAYVFLCGEDCETEEMREALHSASDELNEVEQVLLAKEVVGECIKEEEFERGRKAGLEEAAKRMVAVAWAHRSLPGLDVQAEAFENAAKYARELKEPKKEQQC